MALDIRIEDRTQYVRVSVTGTPTMAQMLELVDELARRSGSMRADRVLIDLRGVATLFGFMQQSSIGVRVAAKLPHLKIASVVPHHRRTGVSERAARNEGGQLQVFTEEEAAVRWLLD